MNIITTREFKSICQKNFQLRDMELIIRKALGEKAKIKSVHTSKQGDVNSSYIINTENPKCKFFLKVEDNDNIPSFYSGQIEREVEGIIRCKKAKIPCANIISYNTDCKEIGKKYILTEYIEGNLLSEKWNTFSFDQKLSVKKEMLRIIDRMQSIESSWFGDIYENGTIGRYSSWTQAAAALIDIAAKDCLCLDTLNNEEVKLIKDASNKSLQKLKKDYAACFNHMDIHWHNIFVNEHSGIIKIIGIIDFGSSLYAPKFTDPYRLNSGFLYGTENFYDEKITKKFMMNENEIFSARLLNTLDYYVFLSIMRKTSEVRKNMINYCRKYLNK